MAHAFRTVDSQHPQYTVARSAWVAPWFFLTFIGGAVAVFASVDQVVPRYAALMRLIAQVDADVLSDPASLSFRPFFLLSAVVLSLFILAPWVERMKLLLFAVGATMATMLIVDALMLWVLIDLGGPSPFSLAGNVLNAFAQLVSMTAVFLAAHHLPPTIDVVTEQQRPARYTVILASALSIAVAVSVLGATIAYQNVEWLRDHAILGGLGPGLFLFAPTLQLTLFLFAIVGRQLTARRRRRILREVQAGDGRDEASMAFLVPAHNEAETIADCIHSIARTASNFAGTCAVYIVDNRSSDDTARVAREALDAHSHLDGHVLYCGTPGKSNALNYGLERITEDIVVRVDSDTTVAEDVLPRVAAHFRDPSIAGVGGLAFPLAHQKNTLFGRVRSIEVLINVGAVRAGQGVIDAIMVLPGQLSAYRRELITRLGGFASGINGEDTELTVRVGRAGYRVIMDPDIRLYSEVPHSIPHLREQRIRWSRSLIHVYKCHISALWYLQGWRGVWLLPFGLLSSVRRALLPLFILFALVSLVVAPDQLFIRDGLAVVAVIGGPHLILIGASLAWYRRLDLLPFTPGYLALRVFRSYVAVEALLSMRHRSLVKPVVQPAPETRYLTEGRRAEDSIPTAAEIGTAAGQLVQPLLRSRTPNIKS